MGTAPAWPFSCVVGVSIYATWNKTEPISVRHPSSSSSVVRWHVPVEHTSRTVSRLRFDRSPVLPCMLTSPRAHMHAADAHAAPGRGRDDGSSELARACAGATGRPGGQVHQCKPNPADGSSSSARKLARARAAGPGPSPRARAWAHHAPRHGPRECRTDRTGRPIGARGGGSSGERSVPATCERGRDGRHRRSSSAHRTPVIGSIGSTIECMHGARGPCIDRPTATPHWLR